MKTVWEKNRTHEIREWDEILKYLQSFEEEINGLAHTRLICSHANLQSFENLYTASEKVVPKTHINERI